MAEQRKRAAIYLRISQDREGRELGVDRQEKLCRELCAREEMDVVDVFTDNDVSASRYSRKHRPGYAALIDAARRGHINVIVAYSFSRLTRRMREALDLIELAETGAVEVRTVSSGQYDLTNAYGRDYARSSASRDQMESEVNSERSKDERRQRRERGLPNGGQRPFGWEKDGITPHPIEFPLLRAGVEDLLAGVSLGRVAREWSEETGRTIRATTVRRIMRSPRIAGKIVDGRPAAWDPVVNDEEAAALRGLTGGTHPKYAQALLSNWAVCGLCGSRMLATGSYSGNLAYACADSRHVVVQREPRDQYVRQLVAAYLDREGVVAAADTAPIAARHAVAGARLGDVADAFAAGEITREQAARATARLRAQLEAAERDLAAATLSAAVPSSGAAFLDLDTARQRAVLAALPWRAVLLSPGRGARRFDPATVRVEPI